MFGRKPLAQKLSESGGTVAWANVLDAKIQWTSGWNYENGPYTVGDHKHMKVKVQVEPEDGEPPFEASFHQTFVGHIPIQGFQGKVIFDPSDHDKIAMLEDTIVPPGLSHEQAEHVAERHRRMEEAAENGTLPQFIQEEIRAATAQASGNGSAVFQHGGSSFVLQPHADDRQ